LLGFATRRTLIPQQQMLAEPMKLVEKSWPNLAVHVVFPPLWNVNHR